MKKTLLILTVILTAAACKNKEDKTEETTIVPEAKTAAGYAYSESFNQSMNNVLTAYYNLKDALVIQQK